MVVAGRFGLPRVGACRNLTIVFLLSLCALWGSAVAANAASCPPGAVPVEGSCIAPATLFQKSFVARFTQAAPVLFCQAGFADCNNNDADGCETNIVTDRNNCGSCGAACPGSQACVNGTCVKSSSVVGTPSASANPINFGQSVTFTVTVAAAPGSTGTPSGGVTFMDGGSTLGTAVLSGGSAAYSTTALSVGSHSITALYNGDINFIGNTSPSALTVTVNDASHASMTLTSSLNPSSYGQTVTLGATIAGNGGGAPSGTLTFLDGATALGSVAVNTRGVGYPIAGGEYHSCALTGAGGVQCWGYNSNGQLGDPTNNSAPNANPTPLAVSGLTSGITAVSAGGEHSCALTGAGGVKCWGTNFSGELGTATNSGTSTPNPTPVDVSGLTSGVAAITSGFNHTCALTSAGGVKCWGFNNAGQLGDTANSGTYTANPTPVDVSGLTSGVVAIAAGRSHTCALTGAGGVKCWGNNNFGQLGNATNSGVATANPAPLDVSGLGSGVTAIAAGGDHTCALTSAGAVKCWGRNTDGELGVATNNSTANPNPTPVDVSGLTSGVMAIAAGDAHSCALTGAGGVKCWGNNAYGQLGNGINDGSSNPTPVDVSGLTGGVSAVAAGSNHTCALSSDGSAACWGLNHYGELGATANNGSDVANASPLSVTNFGSGAALVYGNAALSTAAITAGGHSITAFYSGDANHDGSTSSALSQTVNQIATATALGSSANPSLSGQSVTFTATVTSSGGTPAGIVTFLDGATSIGTAYLSGGTAALTTADLTVGLHSITAAYGGDTNFTGSSSSAVGQTVNKGATTTAVTPSANPSVPGQSVTFTATVSVTSPASGSPIGTVTFLDGATSLGTVSLSGGAATLSTSALALGSHSIGAVYNGDGNYQASTSSVLTQTVNKGATTTAVTSSANPSLPGQSVTFTAAVSVTSPASGTPIGTVTFKDGATVLGSGTLSGGTASVTTAALAVGNHMIKAVYGGDGDFKTSTSTAVAQKVTKGATSVAATASPAKLAPGSAVTLAAQVDVTAPASATPSGQVTFKEKGVTLGVGTIASGAAQFTVNPIPIGTHRIAASYSGDSDLAASAGVTSFTVSAAVGPQARVNATTAGSQQTPAVAALKSGYVVAWASDGQDGSGFGICAQRYTATGAKAGGELAVNTVTAGDQTGPAIAGLSDGGFVVVWQSAGQDGSGYGIYGQRYKATGAKAGSAFKVNTTTANDQSQPAVAALAGGGFVVTWTSSGQDGSGLGVYAQLYDALGKASGTEFPVNKTTAGDQSMPSIAGLTGGGFVIAWQSNGQDGSGLGVYAQRYSATGVRAGGEVRVNTTTVDDQGTPRVAGFSDGGYVVVWASNNQDGSGEGIYAQAFNDAGARVNVEFKVNTTTALDQYQPAAAGFASGNFVAVWTSQSSDGSLENIFAQRFLLPGTN